MVNKNDIIIFNNFEKLEYDYAIKKAASYAVLSVPYTWDRMGLGNSINGIRKRIENIIKGKIGEYLLELFCKSNGIAISKEQTSTEFWKCDKKDFEINGKKFDLKNNFFGYSNGILEDEIINFPALIPSSQYDESIGYIFSFMEKKNFFSVELSDDALFEISQINKGCCGCGAIRMPEYFTTERNYFLDMFEKHGKQNVISINSRPSLIICGIKEPNDDTIQNFKHLDSGSILKYKSGIIKTRTNNLMTEVKNLKPFKNF